MLVHEGGVSSLACLTLHISVLCIVAPDLTSNIHHRTCRAGTFAAAMRRGTHNQAPERRAAKRRLIRRGAAASLAHLWRISGRLRLLVRRHPDSRVPSKTLPGGWSVTKMLLHALQWAPLPLCNMSGHHKCGEAVHIASDAASLKANHAAWFLVLGSLHTSSYGLLRSINKLDLQFYCQQPTKLHRGSESATRQTAARASEHAHTHNLALFGITGSIVAAKAFWLFVQSLQWHLHITSR